MDAGLRNPPEDGSFYITVADDATGTPVAYRIDVDLDGAGADTSLERLDRRDQRGRQRRTASITVDQRLSLDRGPRLFVQLRARRRAVSRRQSKTLAGLGINTFFTGSSAADIAVRDELQRRFRFVRRGSSENRTGDGINAGRHGRGAQRSQRTVLDGTLIGATTRSPTASRRPGAEAANRLEAADAVNLSLSAQRESVSGVSLDEEAIELLRFERAFQGAARYVSTVDRLMQDMMALVR
jgi:flagellar hook-associated protein 1 FlgK